MEVLDQWSMRDDGSYDEDELDELAVLMGDTRLE
jgi:hypothetical protein